MHLFVVKNTALKQQISKFYPQIQRTEESCHSPVSHRPVINVKGALLAYYSINCFLVTDEYCVFKLRSHWRR